MTSNSSNGSPLPWHIEYWFNSSSGVRNNHPSGGVAGGDGMPLYRHHAARPATGPYEIHLKPTERLSKGGVSVNFMRPVPMFGISVDLLDVHGLSDQFMESIRLWKQALSALTDAELQRLAIPVGQNTSPLAPRRGLDTLYRPLETPAGLAMQPFRAVQPAGNSVLWSWMQEGGPCVPRSYFQVGQPPLDMEVPDGGRDLEFTLRVLRSYNPADQAVVVPGHQSRQSGARGLSQVEQSYIASGNGSLDGLSQAPDAAASQLSSEPRSLMPPNPDGIQRLGTHAFKFKDGYMSVTCDGAGAEPSWHEDRPRWSCSQLQMNAGDALRLTVYGDGSGASLVVTLHGRGKRDFAFPIDFTGRRELIIPTEHASWSQEDWGWRENTTRFEHGTLRQIEFGFGVVPAGTTPRVTVEALDLVAGTAIKVNKLSLMMGDAALQIDGPLYTDEYVWFQGGSEVKVYDLNWNFRRSIPVKLRGFELGAGIHPLQFWAQDSQPHVELQMISSGEPVHLQGHSSQASL